LESEIVKSGLVSVACPYDLLACLFHRRCFQNYYQGGRRVIIFSCPRDTGIPAFFNGCTLVSCSDALVLGRCSLSCVERALS
jgi:hypothetical protein